MTVYIGKPKGRRKGLCSRCGAHAQLTYTVLALDGEYSAALLCGDCLEKMKEDSHERMDRCQGAAAGER